MNLKLTISFLLPAAFMLLLVACGDTQPLPDIDATVEARVEVAKASLVAPTAAPLPTYTPLPTFTPAPAAPASVAAAMVTPTAPVPQAEGAPGIPDELAFSEEDVASLVVAKRIIVRTVDMRNVVADVAAAVDGVAELAVGELAHVAAGEDTRDGGFHAHVGDDVAAAVQGNGPPQKGRVGVKADVDEHTLRGALRDLARLEVLQHDAVDLPVALDLLDVPDQEKHFQDLGV